MEQAVNTKTILLAILIYMTFLFGGAFGASYEDLHTAILQVEGWRGKPGDNGNAIGPYQIWRPYWQDAVEHDPSIGGKYEDCRNLVYARKVVDAYFRRYGRRFLQEQNWQSLARIHNGGPLGHRKQATLKYWSKVEDALRRIYPKASYRERKEKP